MDTISGSCEMNDSQDSSSVTHFYHFTQFIVCLVFLFFPIIIKKIESAVKLLG